MNMHRFHLKNEKQKQQRSKTTHVTIVVLIHLIVWGDRMGWGWGCRLAGLIWGWRWLLRGWSGDG